MIFAKSPNRIGQLGIALFLSLSTILGLTMLLNGSLTQTAVAGGLPVTCWATIDGVTVYSDTTSSPIQTAVDVAADDDVIKVAGNCVGVQSRGGLSQTVYISKSVTIEGGYAHPNWNDTPDAEANPTILDAQGNGRVAYIPDGPGSYNVTLINLQLTNGYISPEWGAAMDIVGVNNRALISNTQIYSNTTGDVGGGVRVHEAQATFQNSEIYSNTANEGGGAIYQSGSNGVVTVTNSSFYSNTAIDGGALHNNNGLITIQNSSFYSNTATRGAALYANGNADSWVENSTFAYGSASEGGGIHNRGALTVTFSTFAQNQASGVGDAIHTWNGTLNLYAVIMDNPNAEEDCVTPVLSNNIATIIPDGSCNPTYTSDPLLSAFGDYGGDTMSFALSANSPAIDIISAGTAGCGTTVTQDQRGAERPFATYCDIGAYEVDTVIARDDSYAANENTTLVITDTNGVLVNDRTDGLSATAVLNTTTDNGALSLESTGAFTYTPNLDFCGLDSFTYYANDGAQNSNIATVNINVLPCAIEANDDAYSTPEDTAVTIAATGVLSNDVNANYAYLLTPPANGTVVVETDGGFTYTPALDFSGEDSFTYYATTATPAPAVYYSFDDGVNPTADLTGLGHDATINSGVTFTSEVTSTLGSGLALNFDLGNEAVYAGGNGANLNLPTFTAAFWVNFDAYDSYAYMVSKGFVWAVQQNSGTGRVNFYTNGLSNYYLTGNTSIDDGEWHHIAVLYDGTTKAIYIDGELDASTSATGDINYYNNDPLQIGEEELDGRIDDFRLYQGGLSQTEIQEAMAGSTPFNVDPATVTMTVTPQNDPVTANDDWYVGSINETLVVPADGVLQNDVDVDSALTAAVDTAPSVGSLSFNADGGFSYTPPLDATGPISYTYIASDGTFTDTATVTMTFGTNQCHTYLNSSGQAYNHPTADAIEQALADAQDGDLIKIAGYCPLGINANGETQSINVAQNVTLQGGYTNTNWLANSNPTLYPTTLDGLNEARVIAITNTTHTTIDGLTITGGSTVDAGDSEDGGGINIEGYSTVTLSNNLITHNYSDDDGGGVHIDESSMVTIEDTQIISNTADDEGGGIRVYSGTTTIANSFINENFADDDAGGLDIEEFAVVTVTNTTINQNVADDDGGAIETDGLLWLINSELIANYGDDHGAIDNDDSDYNSLTIIQSSVISGNVSADLGGSIDNDGIMHISDSLLQNNRAEDDDGGAIDNSDPLFITNTQFINNSSSDDGGAIFNSGPMTLTNVLIQGNQAQNGAGLFLIGNDSVIINDSTIAGNMATGSGGAFYLVNNSILTVTNSTVYNNTAVQAGALFNESGQVLVQNSTISSNTADQDGAIAQSYDTDNSIWLQHSTIVSNTAMVTDTAVSVYSGTITTTHSIFAYNGAANCHVDGGSFVSGGYNLDDGTSCSLSSTGDLTNQDPLLQPLANNGGSTLTHLPASNSPVVDVIPVGLCTLTTDQRGSIRPFGSACDIGAVEFGFVLYLPVVLK